MNIIDYSDKSFVVTGDTKQHKEELKKLGGKWNSNLSCGAGWIFSLKSKEQVEKFVNEGVSSIEVSDDFETVPCRLIKSVKIDTSTPIRKLSLFEEFVEFIKNSKSDDMNRLLREYLNRDKDENISLSSGLEVSNAEEMFYNFITKKKPTIEEYQKIQKESFIELALCYCRKM